MFIVAYLSLYLRLFGLTFPALWHLSFAYFTFIISPFCLFISFTGFWLRTVNISVGRRWWDPVSPICITNHVRHLCDTFAMIWNDLRSGTTRDDKRTTLCDHLRCLIPFYNTLQCSLSLLRHFLTFSDAFRPFATFLDFALFNTPPICVAFSGTFHQTLFTWLVHHSFGFSAIISVRSALCFTDISRFSLLL